MKKLTRISASDVLKRNTDSVKCAMENDVLLHSLIYPCLRNWILGGPMNK